VNGKTPEMPEIAKQVLRNWFYQLDGPGVNFHTKHELDSVYIEDDAVALAFVYRDKWRKG